MLPELIYRAIESRDKIEYKLDLMSVDEREVLKRWIEYNPTSVDIESIGAIDGSMNFIEYRGFILYAVSSLALTYTNKTVFEKWINDIDLLYPHEYSIERIRMYMNILEGRLAIKTLKTQSPDVLLLDGSILSHFSKRLPYIVRNIPRSLLKKYLSRYLGSMELHVHNNKEYIYSKELFYELIQEDLEVDIITALETLFEFLEYYYTLIELINTYKDSIVAIAKTSVSRRVFRKSIKPDLVVFDSIARKCGFSNPEIHTIRFPSRDMMLLDVSKEFEMQVTVLYFRLEEGERVYRLELPGERDIDEIKHIINILEPISVKGYPYPLISVHKKVEITNLDMDKIRRIMSIEGQTLRERW